MNKKEIIVVLKNLAKRIGCEVTDYGSVYTSSPTEKDLMLYQLIDELGYDWDNGLKKIVKKKK